MSEPIDSNITRADERELVARMLSGDQAAFDSFFSTHAGRLAGFAARRCALDAAAVEDIVQQTMINAIRNLRGFRGESTLFTWLCQICRHVLADVHRKSARQPSVDSLESLAETKSSALLAHLIDYRDPLETCSDDSERSAIREIVNRLPPRYARILELRYGDELAIEEIARVLGLSESAAQSLLARARRAFADSWKEQADDTEPERAGNNDAGTR